MQANSIISECRICIPVYKQNLLDNKELLKGLRSSKLREELLPRDCGSPIFGSFRWTLTISREPCCDPLRRLDTCVHSVETQMDSTHPVDLLVAIHSYF